QWCLSVAPNSSQELVPEDHLPPAFGQILQQLKLSMSQSKIGAALSRRVRPEIHADATEDQLLNRRPSAPEDHSHACYQFLEIERFSDVIIRAKVQASKLVGLLGSRGQEEKRCPTSQAKLVR